MFRELVEVIVWLHRGVGVGHGDLKVVTARWIDLLSRRRELTIAFLNVAQHDSLCSFSPKTSSFPHPTLPS